MLYSYSQVLVCTSALEEGIDVSLCEFVVRFSEVHTTKSFIQGSGRARKKHSMVYAFMNDVDHERAQVASPHNRPTPALCSISSLERALTGGKAQCRGQESRASAGSDGAT